MDISNFSIEQASILASQITWFVGGLIVLFFILAVINSKLGKANEFVSYAPNLFTSLGIFGTFAGIVVGLMAFDANDIDGSVQGLLNGLKTAFITSIIGIFTSILYKLLHSTRLIRPSRAADVISSASPEDILAAINNQKTSLELLIKSIGGEGDGSIISQMKLLRADLNDNQKQSLNYHKQSSEDLTKISGQLGNMRLSR